jgi:hypothetical protein
MGKKRNKGCWWGKKPLEYLGYDGKIILKRILTKHDMRPWTGFIWLRIGTSGGFL